MNRDFFWFTGKINLTYIQRALSLAVSGLSQSALVGRGEPYMEDQISNMSKVDACSTIFSLYAILTYKGKSKRSEKGRSKLA